MSGGSPWPEAEDGDELGPGLVLLAPPDHHLLVNDSRVTLSRGPRENGHRPAVDVTFRSAAATHGSRVVGVVLSGTLDDGAAGTVALRLRGGVAIAQDPEEALHASMPRAAIEAAAVEHVVGAAKVPDLLVRLVGQDVPTVADTAYERLATEARMAGPKPGRTTNISVHRYLTPQAARLRVRA